ncbi:MAG: hypothetical protein IJ949_04700, partial [Oscillospiraceae bacterium]|nr:hypothetical protein [Oscillospiraceae bacterium]
FAPLSYAADTSELITITKTVKDNSADIVDKKVADDTNAEYYLMNYNNYVVVKFTIEKPGVYAITPFVTYAQTASTLTVTTSVEDKTFTNSYTTSTVNGTELNVEAGEHTFYAGEYTITFKKGAGASIHFRGITLTCRRELLPSEIPVEKLTLTKTVKDNRSDIVGTPDIAEDKTDSFLMYMNDDVTFKFKVSVPGVYKIVPFGTYGSTGILKFTTTVQSTVFTTELPQVSTGSTLSAEAGEYIFHSGEYDIKFEKIAGANLLFEGIRLVYDRELTTFEADVPMIKTVADITDSSEAITGKYASFWAFGEGNYITFTYDIPTAGVYSMQFIGGCGTDKVSGSATFKVEIDGNTYYKNFKTQANFYEQVEVFVADHAFAEAGTYNLTITPISIPVGSMTIRSVTLDMINYLEPDDVEYSVTHNAAENYKVSDVAVDATTTACMLGAGNCIAWNVTPAYNGHYEIFVNAASVNASLGAYKNELQIGECRFTDSAADASSAKYVSLGEVALFAGESYVIKIESFRKSAAEVYLSDIKLVFRSGFADELIVKDIVILNEDGVRMPHAVIDGATASAQITVYKSGRVNDEIKLFFAQYAQDGALASVASVACDVSEMSDKETGTFAKELVFSGNGGSVRVFMLENGTLKPLYCPIGYEETDIFANVEFPAEVPYKLASEVLDEHN